MSSVWIVRATEDDYYPAVEIIGAFPTKEEAETFAASQPRCVDLWPGQNYGWGRGNYFDYTVEEVSMSPTGPWRPERKDGEL